MIRKLPTTFNGFPVFNHNLTKGSIPLVHSPVANAGCSFPAHLRSFPHNSHAPTELKQTINKALSKVYIMSAHGTFALNLHCNTTQLGSLTKLAAIVTFSLHRLDRFHNVVLIPVKLSCICIRGSSSLSVDNRICNEP